MKKPIVILGAGESGTGAALLAKQLGYPVFVSDFSPIVPVFQKILEQNGIPYEGGKHSMDLILNAREVIKSPGIPEKAPVIQAIRQKGIKIVGEIEFAARHVGKCTLIAITGSNGKTTTTRLIHHLLAFGGLDARAGGNVGNSFAELVMQDIRAQRTNDEKRIFVLEVSSFQLDDVDKFRPNIAVLLNITPDHLDRYDYQMANYVKAKFRITMNQKRGNWLITNADDPEIQGFLAANPAYVRCKMDQIKQADLRNGYVRIGQKYSFDVSSTALQGPHNRFNAACAIRIALKLGLDNMTIEQGLYHFTPPPHRMEKVAEKAGVLYINDSKATNVDSVFYALQSMDRPTIWIVGGIDKGNNYQILLPHVEKRVKAIVCMGLDNSRIRAAFDHLHIPTVETASAEEAVEAAAQIAKPGDAVLLSPACASFDLFKNYEHRGDQFRAAVLKR
ncbi:MAG: UDP-N-acetylmuramoyl-L-alanine--D-glutamate ligase [Bacteroidetes bacterium]|nr:UDP-N-acetylmuramoyl-L-alanine--D-glutamate ligase [Bacteroidota bacterium]